MKKTFFIGFICAVIVSAALFAPAVFALDLGMDRVGDAAELAGYSANDTNETAIAERLGKGVQAVLSFVGIVFTALVVYAGLLWMMARGDDTQVKKAQEIVKASVIGLVLTLSAYTVTAFVLPQVLNSVDAPGGPGGDGNNGGEYVNCCFSCSFGTDLIRDPNDFSGCDALFEAGDDVPAQRCFDECDGNSCHFELVPDDQCS